ncbi:putative leucine-rich repeat domain superfamily [Helianthus anomalus]
MLNTRCILFQIGQTTISQVYLDLTYIVVYVSDQTNAALEFVGMHLKNLNDFRMVLLDTKEVYTDLPLANGVRALLRGCKKLKSFALYLQLGGVTGVCLTYNGQNSQNIRWMLLGYLVESESTP